jgi:hypothetical protein
MPKSLIGWIALIVVGVVIWRNPAATGHFLFVTIPGKISSFVGSIGSG